MQVFQNEMKHINFFLPAATVVPGCIAMFVLIICALIAVNMILLLCAAWIVLYAGLIFLGFGGCRWTSDMAINYYRTVLGVGVSLMTMQLIIGMGIKFLQDLVASTGDNPDVGQLAIVMVACIILAVIAHRLPQMVAGMAVSGGHNGAVGGVGVMTLLGAGIAGASIVRSVGAGAGAAVITEGAAASAKLLEERIAAAEAAIAAGNGGAAPSVVNNQGGVDYGRSNAAGVSAGGSTGSGPKAGSGPGVARQRSAGNAPARAGTVGSPVSGNPGQQAASSGLTGTAPSQTANEPPQTKPMTPDEARGFPPEVPGAPIDWEEERRRYVAGEDRAM
jgi:type IV secretion system protein TrbL